MVRDKKENYAEVLLNAYNNKLLRIIWNTFGFSLGVDAKKEGLIPELKEEKFRQYAFMIIRTVAALAENEKIEDISEDDLKIAKAVYAQEKDLKKHLYIKRNSKVNCFKFLESQIISYRNEKNPAQIDADSAILNIKTEKDDEDSSISFEVSKRDLEDMIDHLTELKAKMDMIDGSRK